MTLFASLDDRAIPKLDTFLKKRICSLESKFFPSGVDPIKKESKKKNISVAFPESASFQSSR